MTMQVVAIPAAQAIGSRPRKSPIFDTDGWASGVPMGNLTLFSNFSAFNTAGLALDKRFGRDTNLTGGTGLPAAHHMYVYGFRNKIRTLSENIGGALSFAVFEEINRARELSSWTFRFSTSTLITCQHDEIPSGSGPAYVGTTIGAATVMSLSSGVPARANSKDGTISGRPLEIVALESFSVVIGMPTGFPPFRDLYVTAVLEGLLLQGITG